MLPSLPLLVLACDPDGETTGPSGPLVKAKLREFELGSVALMIGGLHVDAELLVEDRQGDRFTAPVAIDGLVIGLAVTGMLTLSGNVPLYLPDDDIGADDLLGAYTGVGVALVPGAGVATQHLVNESGVELNTAALGLGIGVEVAFEAVTLARLDEFEPVEDDDDVDTTDTGDSADTGGTAGAEP